MVMFLSTINSLYYHMVHLVYLFLLVVAASVAALVIADWSNSQFYTDEYCVRELQTLVAKPWCNQ